MKYQSAEEQRRETEARIQELEEKNKKLREEIEEVKNSKKDNAEMLIVSKIASMFKELEKKIKDALDSYSGILEEAGVKLGNLEDKMEQQEASMKRLSDVYNKLIDNNVIVAKGNVGEMIDSLQTEEPAKDEEKVNQKDEPAPDSSETLVEEDATVLESANEVGKVGETVEPAFDSSEISTEETHFAEEPAKDEEKVDQKDEPAPDSSETLVGEDATVLEPANEVGKAGETVVPDNPLSNMLDVNQVPSFDQDAPFKGMDEPIPPSPNASSLNDQVLYANNTKLNSDNAGADVESHEETKTETTAPSNEVEKQQEFVQSEDLTPTSIQASSLAAGILNNSIINNLVPESRAVNLMSLDDNIYKIREENKYNIDGDSRSRK